MSNRGYVVSPDMKDHLLSELERCKVQYRIVQDATDFGNYPRPVLISSERKPDGWTRYARCQKCQKPMGLTWDGKCVRKGVCNECSSFTPTIEQIWKVIEQGFSHTRLQLPEWINQYGVASVADVRDKLLTNELANVGPERVPIVAESLDSFRCLITNILKAEL